MYGTRTLFLLPAQQIFPSGNVVENWNEKALALLLFETGTKVQY